MNEQFLAGRAALVAGGTGNVGRHIVHALLDGGATVVVPSRSAAKLDALRARLAPTDGRLVTLTGDVADERGGERLRDEISRRLGTSLDGVVATLGRYAAAPSVVAASRADLVAALDDYVVAHFVVARTFLPALRETGSYTLVNGPSAFGAWPGSGLVSIATAAQAMLARVLAAEAGSRGVRITELVIHPSAWIGPDTTGGGGGVDGGVVGRYAAGIVAGRVAASGTVHLESVEQLAEVGV